jgi:outer membrane protein
MKWRIMRITPILALPLVVALPYCAHGQVLRTTSANPDSSLQSILAGMDGTSLPLRDAIRTALDASTSVRTAEALYRSAHGAARREAGAFDPILFFDFTRLVQDQPTASFFSGASVLATRQNSAAGGIRMNLPIGTSIEASLNSLSLGTNSAFANLNPQYTTFGNVSLRQPLLGGFSASASKNATKTEREEAAAKARFDQEVLGTSTRVEQQYWDLYAAVRDYAVQKLTRDRAEAFLKDTETRARTGLIGPNQVANARTFLAEQELLLLDREEQLDRISDALSSLIGTRPDSGKARFIPVDSPPETFAIDDVDLLVRQAQQKNLSIEEAKDEVESRRALAKAASWEALPQLDLIASYGGNGLGGRTQDVIFNGDTLRTTQGGTLSNALSQALKGQFPSWRVGFEFSMPILLRGGLGEEERLEADVMVAEQHLIELSRALEEEVRRSCRELSNGRRRMKAAREGVDAAQEQVRIGLIEFENGRTTAFELVRLGADFAVAQQRYSQALVQSAKAAASLRELTSGSSAVPEQ